MGVANAAATGNGRAHSTVVTLTTSNFDDHISDAANGLWFLKFYAPWCGHCKTLAPILDKVAPFLAGKMSIGKVDCTVEKKICSRFSVRGYPTLKFYRDGDFHDYTLGRDADSIIIFGEKMSARAVSLISSHDEAKATLLAKSPVAFLAYDPNADSNADESNSDTDTDTDSNMAAIDASGAEAEEKEEEKFVRSTERMRVFGQVARKLQAEASFGMLRGVELEEADKFFGGDDTSTDSTDAGTDTKIDTTHGFIARIEEGVPTRVYRGPLATPELVAFVQEHNLPVVLELEGHNFRTTGRRGKPLAIAAYDPGTDDADTKAKTDLFRKEMKRYAVGGARKDDYVFATMDANRWGKFLAQFGITKEGLPEMFVIDVPARKYWQDSSVFGVAEFIDAHQNGDIEERSQEKRKGAALEEVAEIFVKYMPWSLIGVLVLFGLSFCLFLPPMESNHVMRPPIPMEETGSGEEEKESNVTQEEVKKEQ